MNNVTIAAETQPCAACEEPILSGARMQRGCHWRCYMAAWRAGTARDLPRGRQGRPRDAASPRFTAADLAAALAVARRERTAEAMHGA